MPTRPRRVPVLGPTEPGRARPAFTSLFTPDEELVGAAAAISTVVDLDFVGRLVAPPESGYRVRRLLNGDRQIEAELQVVGGPKLPVAIACPMCDREWLSRQELRIRLDALLASAKAAEALLKRMRDAVRARQSGLECEDSGIRLTGMRLAPFVLTRRGPDEPEHAVILTVRGGIDDMLRPSRDEWRVRTSAELDRKLGELRPVLARRAAAATQARALGAAGFIDKVALAVLDALPRSREGHLRKLTRYPVLHGRATPPGCAETAVRLSWRDGVVRASFPTGRTAQWAGDHLISVDFIKPDAVVGRPLTEIVDHPCLAGLTVTAVHGEPSDYPQVNVRLPTSAFAEDGRLWYDICLYGS